LVKENDMSWQKMRIPGAGAGDSLPGDRGRYLLWLEPPYVEGEGRYVHFSWKEGSFCLRDYIQHLERRQGRDTTALDVWRAAQDRIPAKGELYVPVENFEFWTAKLKELTERRRHAGSSGLWSRLSSRFAPKPVEAAQPVSAEAEDHSDDVYGKFVRFWREAVGFDIVERTVGCSARYRGEPLLWVYPTYFQVAPRGKGNSRHSELVALRNQFFPELRGRGTVSFESEYFSWDRFQSFVGAGQEMVRREGV
jgi:hypothetical protein